MMADSGIDTTGLDEVVALVLTDLTPTLQAVSMAVALEAQDRIAAYPAESHRPQAFKTVKQRRAFFVKLRRGQIQVPYRRGSSPGSETLGRKWMIERMGDGTRLRNTASYAGLAHSQEDQAAYHTTTGWKTDKGVAQGIENDGTATRMAEQAIEQKLGAG